MSADGLPEYVRLYQESIVLARSAHVARVAQARQRFPEGPECDEVIDNSFARYDRDTAPQREELRQARLRHMRRLTP